MAYRDAKDVMLYFRGVADEDHDDGATGAANLNVWKVAEDGTRH